MPDSPYCHLEHLTQLSPGGENKNRDENVEIGIYIYRKEKRQMECRNLLEVGQECHNGGDRYLCFPQYGSEGLNGVLIN